MTYINANCASLIASAHQRYILICLFDLPLTNAFILFSISVNVSQSSTLPVSPKRRHKKPDSSLPHSLLTCRRRSMRLPRQTVRFSFRNFCYQFRAISYVRGFQVPIGQLPLRRTLHSASTQTIRGPTVAQEMLTGTFVVLLSGSQEMCL